MRYFLTIIATAIYVLGAIATYSHDRELAACGFWKWPANQTKASSIAIAVVWPAWGIVLGEDIILGGPDFGCSTVKDH